MEKVRKALVYGLLLVFAVVLGNLQSAKAEALSPEEVETKFAAYIQNHKKEAIAEYRMLYGKEINADNVRELSKDYAPDGPDGSFATSKAARTKWSGAVHKPSSALAKEIYSQMLKERPVVVFTAGGAGSGKSTSIRQFKQLKNTVDGAQIIYDTTLSDLKSSEDKIQEALNAGWTVRIIYVYRDPIESFINGVLPRAEANGRTLPVETFLETHMGAPEVLLEIADRYKGKSVEIAVLDNTHEEGKVVKADLRFLQGVAQKYKRNELEQKLWAALEEAYDKGKKREEGGISRAVYVAFGGKNP